MCAVARVWKVFDRLALRYRSEAPSQPRRSITAPAPDPNSPRDSTGALLGYTMILELRSDLDPGGARAGTNPCLDEINPDARTGFLTPRNRQRLINAQRTTSAPAPAECNARIRYPPNQNDIDSASKPAYPVTDEPIFKLRYHMIRSPWNPMIPEYRLK